MKFLPILLVLTLGGEGARGRIRDIVLGLDGCVVLPLGQTLRSSDRLLLLAEDRVPTTLSISSVREGLTKPPDCKRMEQDWGRVTPVALPREFQGVPFFALRPAPHLQTIAGGRRRLPAAETKRLAHRLARWFPGKWSNGHRLVHAYRYGARGGPTAVELFVGLPTLNVPGAAVPIQAIAIRRAFIIGERVLAVQEFDRASGREERVDTSPPELTFDSWSDSETERTVAFASQGGRTWKRFYTDIGSEGINWVVQDLRDGLSEERVFLYTSR